MYLADNERENKEIVKRYRGLLRAWNSNKGVRERNKVKEAFHVASEAHRTMRRLSGEPYIYHPIEVARIVAGEIGLGETAIICSLLHDVVEDNENYTIEFIQDKFGPKVAYIVDGLTKIKDGYETMESSAQAENFKKMLLTLSDDVRVILIKLADRLHNMRTLDAMPARKQKNIAAETLYLYAPLAHRLGLYAIKSELEDLSLKYIEPEVYNTLAQKLHDTEYERARFIQRFILPVKKALAASGISFEIDSREKSIYSIWKKMQTKEIPFEEVYDLFAVRIIIDSPPELEKINCWQVYSIVTDHYSPKLNRLRDWISTPKANGYESLHTTVMSQTGQWVEVQIRTRRMHEIAERGYAAHWKYKLLSDPERVHETGLDQWLSKVREILRTPDTNALNFLDDIKLTLFTDEVFVFTPRGEIKSLPARSTVLDFAYNIHTQLGNSCIAAKVNHKLVPLNYTLKSGDQIEIIASKKGQPKEEWLNYAYTVRAKTYIKETLKEQRKQFAEEGRTLLESYFTELKIRFTKANITRFMGYYGLSSNIDLYYKVAKNEISLNDVRSCCLEHKASLRVSNDDRGEPADVNGELPVSKMLPSIPDLDDTEFTASECCLPLPGDDIVCYVSTDGFIQVHRTHCPEAIELMSRHAKRMITPRWPNRHLNTFQTAMKVTGIDRKGLIYELINVISEQMNFNIKVFHIETSGDVFESTIGLFVHDTIDINRMMGEIKKISGISTVTRVMKL